MEAHFHPSGVLLTFRSSTINTVSQDDPADFSFYFDTSGRRTCYLAPERFVKQTAPADSSLTPAMDIFSVGYL